MTTDRNILDKTADAYAELQRDPERWQEELNERAEWDVTLADGLEDEDMTTTRDGDVLTDEQQWAQYLHDQYDGSYLNDPDVCELANRYIGLLDEKRDFRTLQQRLDAAEQRAERLERALMQASHAAVDYDHPAWACEDVVEIVRAALTEQERDDA